MKLLWASKVLQVKYTLLGLKVVHALYLDRYMLCEIW